MTSHGEVFGKNAEKHGSKHAFDGNLETKSATREWLKLEFGRSYFIHRVVIYFQFFAGWYDSTDYCVQDLAKFSICAKGRNGTKVAVHEGDKEKKSCGQIVTTLRPNQKDQIHDLVCNVRGNAVVISEGENGFVAIQEVVIQSTGKQISLYRQTSLQHGTGRKV